ncbi:dynein light chain Tctex-type 5-like [Gigantopelta aegis]|uniref:dynein light chain Tctex-type 5-like n=1 Tax=Gigantopelta aegis TaxID=1735272 RepID=UPI001B88B71B|nr:dynein light chain Tctex-type 5-like [Gigantopelta aegis]
MSVQGRKNNAITEQGGLNSELKKQKSWSDKMSEKSYDTRSSLNRSGATSRFGRLRSRLKTLAALGYSRNFRNIEESVSLQPTYKMGPDCNQVFSVENAKHIIHGVLEAYLKGKDYDAKRFANLSRTLAELIKERVKNSGISRYKIVAYVTIVEKNEQCCNHGSRCLWNVSTDNYATSVYETKQFTAVGLVFAVYFD